jgi:hypothetical protein
MVLSEHIHSLEQRRTAGGGVANRPGGSPRTDATCWAILALNAIDGHAGTVEAARQALVEAQSADGRIPLMPWYPDAIWPTPLAILAWHRCARCQQPRDKAARFLLGFDRMRIVDDPDAAAVIGHNPTIKGWPWIAGTSPWLEPTAYGLMALRLVGCEEQERALEGRRLILDRQLSSGGWNYGNTTVYGQELRPMPETTGVALQAVAGLVSRQEVAKSIDYLRSQLPALCTPLALAWAVLGLAAWGEIGDPRVQMARIADCQDDYRAWDTPALCLPLLAWYCPTGLLDWLRQLPEEVSS